MKEILHNGNIVMDVDFIIPNAYPDDGETMRLLNSQFSRALRSYGEVSFKLVERDDGFNTITGKGQINCPVMKFEDIALNVLLVSVHWRRALLMLDGAAVLDGTQTDMGVPLIVIENMDRYLSLTGHGRLK